jgi:hypothetical protein
LPKMTGLTAERPSETRGRRPSKRSTASWTLVYVYAGVAQTPKKIWLTQGLSLVFVKYHRHLHPCQLWDSALEKNMFGVDHWWVLLKRKYTGKDFASFYDLQILFSFFAGLSLLSRLLTLSFVLWGIWSVSWRYSLPLSTVEKPALPLPTLRLLCRKKTTSCFLLHAGGTHAPLQKSQY